MKKECLVVALLAFVGAAQAAPVAFTSTNAQTSVAVLTSDSADAQFASSPPTALPITSSSTLFNSTEFVSASSLVADGLLNSQAEADSALGVTSAVASAEWQGTFVAVSRALLLQMTLSNGDSADPQAFGSSSVIVSILQNGMPFYTALFSSSGDISRLVDLAIGATYTLDITASSEADTFTGGSAFASMLTTFNALAVPEPSTVFLFLLPAAGMLISVSRRKRAQSASYRAHLSGAAA